MLISQEQKEGKMKEKIFDVLAIMVCVPLVLMVKDCENCDDDRWVFCRCEGCGHKPPFFPLFKKAAS
jgi:hypothetical protein